VLNPVRAQMVRSAKDWKWSSYRATVGQSPQPAWLMTNWLLSQFAKTKGVAIKHFRSFVQAGKNQPSPMSELKNQIYLGSDKFVEAMLSKVEQGVDLTEIPKVQRRLAVLTLNDYEKQNTHRNDGIIKSYLDGNFSLKEIGDYYGLHYSRVSRIVSQSKMAH
jgi:putative transposase